MSITVREVKKALKRGLIPDPFFISRYALSPYQGCSHGCKYCDGRAERYFVEGVFEKDIVVRSNLPALLKKERSLLREKGIISIGSGTTDAYQACEGQHRITRQLLEEVEDMGYPLLIATKNHRLLKDLDLLKKIQQKSGFILAVSLTTLDSGVLKKMEPGASSVEERLEMLRQAKDAGLNAGVLAMPFLPGLSDSPETMENLYRELSSVGVDFVIPGFLTLRPGRQKDLYLETMEGSFPELSGTTFDLFREDRPGGSPLKSYRDRLTPHFYRLMKKYALPALIPHTVYKDRINLCDEFLILMMHMQDLYRWEGVPIGRIKQALKHYTDWLTPVRRDFQRRRSLPAGYPDLLLREEIRKGLEFLGNPRLADFLISVSEGKTLDYLNLKLM